MLANRIFFLTRIFSVTVNCFEIGQNGSRARALYDEAFLLAHDCSANTSHTDNPANYEMTVRVTRNVPKGDAITLSYAYTLQVYINFLLFCKPVNFSES